MLAKQLLAALVAFFCIALPATADWSDLTSLPIGSRLQVTRTPGIKETGTLQSATADGLSLLVEGRSVAFARSDVRKVAVRRANGRLRNAGLGAAAGAGMGLGIALILIAAENPDFSWTTISLGFAALGAGIGAGIGAIFPGYRTIYQLK